MKRLIFFLLLSKVCFSQTGYNIVQLPYVAPNMSGTIVTMADDAVFGPIASPFPICFYGNTYNQFYIGSNGWVSFSPGQPVAFISQAIPSTNPFVPKNCIMTPWHDIRPDVAGFPPTPLDYVRYQSYGTSPSRYLVISWDNVPMYQCTSIRSTHQVVIEESGNIIVTIVRKSVCGAWANGTATLGLHNASGTMANVVTGRNSTVWGGNSFVPERWLFTPLECCHPIDPVISIH